MRLARLRRLRDGRLGRGRHGHGMPEGADDAAGHGVPVLLGKGGSGPRPGRSGDRLLGLAAAGEAGGVDANPRIDPVQLGRGRVECDEHRHRKGRLRLHQRSVLSPLPIDAIAKPRKVQEWGMEEIRVWLEKIHLEQYEKQLDESHTTGHDLLDMNTDEELEQRWGMTTRLHRKKMLRELQKLRKKEGVSTPRQQSRRRYTVGIASDHDQSVPCITSPVAAHRARMIQGQLNAGWAQASPVRRRPRTISVPDMPHGSEHEEDDNNADSHSRFPGKLKLEITEEPPRGIRRAQAAGLALDLDQVATEAQNVRSSFNFSAEGTLKTEGFEINVSCCLTWNSYYF